MSRATRPRRVLRGQERLAIADALFPGVCNISSLRIKRKVLCLTRPSLVRRALVGRPVSDRAARGLLRWISNGAQR